MFQPIQNESYDEREKRILAFWKEKGIFDRSVTARKNNPYFTFYDGPPFATGLPHYGHFLAGTIKDVVCRYKTMDGYYTPRRFGWDCHGLPVENEVEKIHDLSGSGAIEEFGIAKFNEECRKIVLRYTEEWKDQVLRMGRWVGFDNTYKTMDLPFMESVWWVFKQLFDKGLVYEGYKVMPFSAKLGTPLSNFEATQNYKEVDDPSLTVALTLEKERDTSFLIWTTTPWTLISNLAVMVGPEIEYVKVRDAGSGKKFILAKERLGDYFDSTVSYEIEKSYLGKELEGMRYHPLFDYFKESSNQGAFRVILGNEVSLEDGTGLVHTAPAFGEADFYACQQAGIELVCPVDRNGKFTDEIPEYVGKFVKDVEKDIIRRLKTSGHVFHVGVCRHRYPFCWRSDTPLIYRAMRTWFVAVESLKEKLLEINDSIHWTPEHIKHGRFGKWLEGARDWAISRNRYWGTPIPIWRSVDGKDLHVIGSIKELEELSGEKVNDLHRHFIDNLSFEKEGKVYQRIPEVFDCWFESGSMPYAQLHYPFEHQNEFSHIFPADFIGEGLDQTRGWFYTLTVLGAALFQKPAFKNVVVNGIILAEDGSKMSKRLKNYPDPMLVVKKYGADAIRLYLMHSPAVRAEDLCFQEKGIELVLRQILIPWWNAYNFFVTYAGIYSWKPTESLGELDQEIDRWIISSLFRLIRDVRDGMQAYDLQRAVEPFVGFIDQLTNWYIRRSRRRFWSDEDTPDRHQAFQTLYYVLVELSKVVAPFLPFISESIYLNLRTDAMPVSVHLCDYPKYHPGLRDPELEEAMTIVQKVVSLGHGLRKQHHIKVRQPLSTLYIATSDEGVRGFLQKQQHLINDELNVKNIVYSSNEEEFVSFTAKPNFRTLGKKVGKLMPKVQKMVEALSVKEISTIISKGFITRNVDQEAIILTTDDVIINRQVREGMVAANDAAITVVLDTKLNDELKMEGLFREIVNKINTMRRDAGFEVTDRIHVKMDTTDRVKLCYEQYSETICQEVLAVSFEFEPCNGLEWDLNGESSKISVEKAS